MPSREDTLVTNLPEFDQPESGENTSHGGPHARQRARVERAIKMLEEPVPPMPQKWANENDVATRPDLRVVRGDQPKPAVAQPAVALESEAPLLARIRTLLAAATATAPDGLAGGGPDPTG